MLDHCERRQGILKKGLINPDNSSSVDILRRL
jgi:hypothetical protein